MEEERESRKRDFGKQRGMEKERERRKGFVLFWMCLGICVGVSKAEVKQK
jgi:hypothetical protein